MAATQAVGLPHLAFTGKCSACMGGQPFSDQPSLFSQKPLHRLSGLMSLDIFKITVTVWDDTYVSPRPGFMAELKCSQHFQLGLKWGRSLSPECSH